jgi:signal peptide peptidase SppA
MPSVAVPAELVRLNVPHIDQYFGLWAIHEETFRAAVARVDQLDLRAHVEAQSQQDRFAIEAVMASTVDGVAIINLTGPLMKYVSSMSGGTSTVFARSLIRAAARDSDVRAIMLAIDSPGGTVSGTSDLADEVAAAAKLKPVHAFIEDLGASAAYWVASQATKVFAGRTTMVGSIGTFAVIYDYSTQAAQAGIKVHVIRAGDFKGSGTPGTEVTAEQLAEWQRIVTELNEFFLQGVASGRRMSLAGVRALADGRVHVGAEAEALGLIDGVRTFDEVFAELKAATPKRSRAAAAAATMETDTMSSDTTVDAAATKEPVAATAKELKLKFPDASAEFREQCLMQDLTLSQATEARVDDLRLKNQNLATERDEAKAATKSPGVDELLDSSSHPKGETGGNARQEWDDAVAAKIAAGMPRARAVSAAARENPALRERMVAEHNAEHGRPVS